jgi:hypothetical protein
VSDGTLVNLEPPSCAASVPFTYGEVRKTMTDIAKDDLLAFTRLMMSNLNHPDYEVAKHHRAMVAALEKVESGEVSRLIISMPRKSQLKVWKDVSRTDVA